jgi:hypothetical protein
MSNRFERGKLPPYTIPESFDRLGTRIIGINEIVGGEAPPPYYLPAGTLVWDISATDKTNVGGLLPLDGSAVSRTTYSDLFSAIGVTYGSGNGTTTFNLPSCQDLYSRVLGPSTGLRGSYSRASLPSHDHTITTPATATANRVLKSFTPEGAFRNPGGLNVLSWNTGDGLGQFRAGLNPASSLRLTGYITSSTYELQIGQIIYNISTEAINSSTGKFLPCDGASFNPNVYGELASVLGATSIPNLRGYFPVVRPFTASNRYQTFGSTTLPTHSHFSPVAFTDLLKAGLFFPPSGTRASTYQGPYPGSTPTPFSTTIFSSTYTLGPGADNRPANVALEFLICAI